MRQNEVSVLNRNSGIQRGNYELLKFNTSHEADGFGLPARLPRPVLLVPVCECERAMCCWLERLLCFIIKSAVSLLRVLLQAHLRIA